MEGTVHSVNVSAGGVPKRPVPEAAVRATGLEGDRQAHPRFHGGPERAVSLLGLDVIERLRRDGHPIAPGTTGENLTLAGLDWREVGIGARLAFEHGVELEVLSYATPCATIRASFRDGDILQVSAEHAPGSSRLYTRVLAEGTVRAGERVRIIA